MSKTLVITGGSAGIGEATVNKFVAQGYDVFNLDIQPPASSPPNTHFIPCNVAVVSEIEQAMAHVLTKTDTIDVVVSNAGKFLSATIEETSEADFNELIAVNLKGTFFLLKAVLPVMKQQLSGSIVLIASDQSFVGKSHSAIYGATKGALAQLTKSTAIDYAEFRIRVNAVCPGTIDTPLYRNAIERFHAKSGVPLAHIEASEARMQPLNRIGLPDEVAALIYFLGSDAAAFITGGLYPIDGGYTAR